MKILHYIMDEGETGAVRTHIFEVLYNLSRMGHSIRYVNGNSYSPTPINELETNTNTEKKVGRWQKIKGYFGRSFLRGESLLIWSISREIGLFFSAIVNIRRNRPDVIYRRHSLFVSDYFIGRLFHIPSVKEVNGILFDETVITKRADKMVLRVIDWAERFGMVRADKIIVVTSRLRELLKQEYRVPEDKIVVITNGANTDLFKPMDMAQARKELGLDQDADYVCFVGRLQLWQGVEYLIKSLPMIIEQCPKTQLLVVGEGPIQQDLANLAKSLGVGEKVKFTGAVPYSKVPLYMNAGNVCSLLKVDVKSGLSPLKLYEYMACGKPIVATRVEGLDIIEKNNFGLLVDREDSQQVAQAFSKLLKNEALRKTQGENGRKYVVENQSWASVANKVADVCQNAIDGRRKVGK
jgi:glycosyltransferase involved in cell wall biosynthesis